MYYFLLLLDIDQFFPHGYVDIICWILCTSFFSARRTWTGGCQHGQSFAVLFFPTETFHKLSLTLQQAERPTEAGVKHMMNTWKTNTS